LYIKILSTLTKKRPNSFSIDWNESWTSYEDAEFNDDGFIVETVRPALGRQLLYYDDTKITEVSSSTESICT